MLATSPSTTPARVASPAFQQSPSNKPSTSNYSAFSSLQQSFSSPSKITSTPSTSQPFAPPSYTPPVTAATSRHTPTTSTTSIDDDFGTFASAVQEPTPHSLILSNSQNLTINLETSRQSTNIVVLTAKFSNNLPVRIDEITFQMAVPRVSSLMVIHESY
jgi:hypothetical protein